MSISQRILQTIISEEFVSAFSQIIEFEKERLENSKHGASDPQVDKLNATIAALDEIKRKAINRAKNILTPN